MSGQTSQAGPGMGQGLGMGQGQTTPGWQQYNAQHPASGSTPMGAPGFGQAPQAGAPAMTGIPQFGGQTAQGPYPNGFNASGPSGYGPYPGGYNANPGGPLGHGMGQMPPQMGQFPPRQAGGPMGPPMTDPNSAGGFFGHPGMGFRGGNGGGNWGGNFQQ